MTNYIIHNHLCNEGSNPDDDENRVPAQTFEHVPLPVDLPGIDLVEEGHEDKGVEDDGEVLGWRRQRPGVGIESARVDVEPHVTWQNNRTG